MVSINYSSREVCCKIVYYGPGLSGKTTNLLYVHSKVPSETRGKMISLATEADRTLYFDFLPINIGTINGFAAKFQLYTVPGQVYYNATRKLVLRGVDGVVFVADSQPDKMEENIESLVNLEENLREYGYDVNELPMVIQYNKRDLPGVLSVEELNQRLNVRGLPHFGASATVGTGVFDTLKLIIKLVLEKAKRSATDRSQSTVTVAKPPVSEPAPAPEQYDAPVTAPPAPEQYGAPVTSPPADAPTHTDRKDESYGNRDFAGLRGKSTQPVGVISEAPRVETQPVKPEPTQYRPYPGSHDSSENPDRKVSSANFSPRKVDDGGEAVAVSRKIHAGRGEDSDLIRPAMAPSLKRRADKKKRGFFKRLFGIK